MVTTSTSGFLETLLGAGTPGANGAAWFDRLRAAALERANALSVPSVREEEWRFTDLAPLTRLAFQPVSEGASLPDGALDGLAIPEAQARLVFVDGLWMPELSRIVDADGMRVLDLRTALGLEESLLASRLGQRVRFDAQLFPALNTAFMRDGAAIVLQPGREISGPIHVLDIATRRERAHAIYPRLLVVAGAASRCTIVEEHVGIGDASYFSAPVAELFLDRDAAVTHIRLQREASSAFHLATCAVEQRAGSRYQAINLTFGARLSRLDLSIVQSEPGCETLLDGLALIDGRQLADTHSLVDHAVPQGRLRQTHKCVVGGAAHAVFNGKIMVREGAQQTDAGQSCRALLLSDRARIDAKPQLEIFADDVKCAHGAAIGQLDADELFYLLSRGLSEARARNLLTYAFAAEVIERIPVRSVAARLATTVLERTQENT